MDSPAIRGWFGGSALIALGIAFTVAASPACGSDGSTPSAIVAADDAGTAPGSPDGSSASDGAVAGDAAKDDDATLTALALSAAPLAPAFKADTLAYAAGPVFVGGTLGPASTTTVTATAKSPTAHITGKSATSGTPSAAMTLVPGMQAIDVTVVSGDGTKTNHYAITVSGLLNDYLKASNTRTDAFFGGAVALSGDGRTLAVSSMAESSASPGINGDQSNATKGSAGAVYVFVRHGSTWVQEAYVKAGNPGVEARFGISLALSVDGNTLAVGADEEGALNTGINGIGAAYVFARSGATWSQQAYLKASNARILSHFGGSVALSADGNTLAVGSPGETSAATGIDGDQSDTTATKAGAAYVFGRTGGAWSQTTYVKASNTRASAGFGNAVALSGDGLRLAVCSSGESSKSTGINGDQGDTSAAYSGAVYIFLQSGGTWAQEAYVKASNTHYNAGFATSVALSSDGSTVAVGADGDSSAATGINGDQGDLSMGVAGAAFVFTRTSTTWSQEAYVKASNTRQNAFFGMSIAISADGNTVAVGALGDSSIATGVNGNQADTTAAYAGAAYAFRRANGTWSQKAYIKASNTKVLQGPRLNAELGYSIALAGDGASLVVGAPGERSNATGVDGNQADTSETGAGAAYFY